MHLSIPSYLFSPIDNIHISPSQPNTAHNYKSSRNVLVWKSNLLWQLRWFFYLCYSLTPLPTIEAYQTVTGYKSILLLILHYSHLFHIKRWIDNPKKDISTVNLLEKSIMFYSYNWIRLTPHGSKKKNIIPWNKNLVILSNLLRIHYWQLSSTPTFH